MTSRSELRVTVCPELSAVSAPAWDALLEPDDAPLLSWAYLEGLESTGCVGEHTGWLPLHLLVHRLEDPRDDDGQLVAAAPAYVKLHSEGEWVWDEEWPDLTAAFGERYFPKLVLAVPFNPVTGGRLLTLPSLPEEHRRDLRALLLRAAQRLCQTEGIGSAHVLFPRGPGFRDDRVPDQGSQLDVLADAEFWPRRQTQYHFHNRGYRSFADFLSELRSHRRNTIRRERRQLADAGITVKTFSGLAQHNEALPPPSSSQEPLRFSVSLLDQMFDMYVATSIRYTGEQPYLNRAFFQVCAERLGDRLELVLAHSRDGELLAGAWNLRGDSRRYGRYWGERTTMPFLHFEVCFYHPIERCIADGFQAFEPGHGGEQKLLRGFEPSFTYSAHWFAQPTLHQIVGQYLTKESGFIDAVRGFELRRCPLRDVNQAEPGTTDLSVHPLKGTAREPAKRQSNRTTSDDKHD